MEEIKAPLTLKFTFKSPVEKSYHRSDNRHETGL